MVPAIKSFLVASAMKLLPLRSSKRLRESMSRQAELCSICYEPISNYSRDPNATEKWCFLPCGHKFGHKCIRNWLALKENPGCPMCRRSVECACGHPITPLGLDHGGKVPDGKRRQLVSKLRDDCEFCAERDPMEMTAIRSTLDGLQKNLGSLAAEYRLGVAESERRWIEHEDAWEAAWRIWWEHETANDPSTSIRSKSKRSRRSRELATPPEAKCSDAVRMGGS
jgi:hypothetical protein